MKYTKEQIAIALQMLGATGFPRKVIEILGYPSNPMLYHWRKKYPELYNSPQVKHWKQASSEFKLEIIQRCFIDGENVKSVSEEIGYTPSSIYGWYRRYRKKGIFPSMKKSDKHTVTPNAANAENIDDLKAQMLEMQMEIDILKETINVLKKDPGVDQTALTNREKAVIIDALKSKYSLPDLCKKQLFLLMRSPSFIQIEAAITVGLNGLKSWMMPDSQDLCQGKAALRIIPPVKVSSVISKQRCSMCTMG